MTTARTGQASTIAQLDAPDFLDALDPKAELGEHTDHTVTHRPVPWYRIPSLVCGLSILLVLIVLAVFAPWIAPYNPNAQNVADGLAPVSAAHWLGTDVLGRDVWSRLLYAGRIDLLIGLTAVIPPFVIGVTLGTIAGFRPGRLETLIMRISDVVMAFPFYVLVAALVFSVGAGMLSIYLAVALVTWASYARIMQGQVATARTSDYVAAARSGGIGTTRILWHHILPNTIAQAVVYAVSDMVVMILSVVTLSYLGLGIAPPTPEWGSMISDGQPFLSTHWVLSTAPGIAVVITGIGLGLIGDGLARLIQREAA
jgi:peptide/nickel transport system permease protein